MKPENILFDEKKGVKIVDFGLGNFYQQGTHCITACGSPCYAPPEMIQGKKYSGSQNFYLFVYSFKSYFLKLIL